MYAGRVAEQGPVDALYHDPATRTRGSCSRRRPTSTTRRAGRLDPRRAAAARPRRSTAARSGRAATGRSTAAASSRRSRRSARDTRRPVTSDRTVGGGHVSSLLEVEDLVVRYPVPRGIVGTVTRAADADGARGRRRLASRSQPARWSRSSASRAAARRRPRRRCMRLVDAEAGAIRFEGRDLTGLGVRATCGRCAGGSR